MRVIILKSCVYCTIYKLLLSHELWFNFCMRVTSYCLLHELWVTFIAQVTSYFLHKNYEFLFVARFTSYFVLGVMIKMNKGFSMKKIYIFYFFYFFYLFIYLFTYFFWCFFEKRKMLKHGILLIKNKDKNFLGMKILSTKYHLSLNHRHFHLLFRFTGF